MLCPSSRDLRAPDICTTAAPSTRAAREPQRFPAFVSHAVRRSEESVSVPNNELGALSSLLSETAADASSTYQNNLHALVATLSERRSARLAHLATTYPAVHYAVLTAIAASIVLAYLVETDQEVLQFLSSLQLRLLFTILIGVFSGVGSVVTDIADPFRGAYRITSTVAQFFPLREALICDVACKRTALDDPEWPPGSEHI